MTTTAWAQPKVEIAFTTAPLAVTPTWTDVTRYARAIPTIQRGKSHELGQQQAGTCTVLLDNRDRRFDPTNTSSPYYPNVLPMKKIRISSVWNGTTYYQFTGYIESWPMKWADAVNDDVEVVAVDGLKVLNLRKIAGHTYRDAVLADSPTGYWALNEPFGTYPTAVDSGSGGNHGTFTGSAVLGVPGANPADVDTALDEGARTGWVSIPAAASPSGTASFSLEMWVTPRATDGGYTYLVNSLAGTDTVGVNIAQTAAGLSVLFIVYDGTNGAYVHSTSAPITLNVPNHVVCVKSGTTWPAGPWKIYVNGVDVGTGGTLTATLGTGTPNLTQHASAICATVTAGAYTADLDGIIQHVAIYNGVALSSAQVLTHYNTVSPWTAAVLTGTRIGALLDAVAWPAADRVIDTGQFYMKGVTEPLSQTTALAYVQKLIDSEGYPATAFIDTQGRFVFQDRAHATPASSATFGDGVGEYPYELDGTTAPILDDLNIYNEVVAQADNGQPQISSDSTSQSAYVKRTLSLTGLQNAYAADVAAVADVWRSRYKTPSTRLATLAIQPSDDATNLFPQVLGRELNDRILVKRTFYTGGGSVMSLDMRIEGITHQITPFGWRTVWQLAPTNPTNLLILGDATFGVIGAAAGNVLA